MISKKNRPVRLYNFPGRDAGTNDLSRERPTNEDEYAMIGEPSAAQSQSGFEIELPGVRDCRQPADKLETPDHRRKLEVLMCTCFR